MRRKYPFDLGHDPISAMPVCFASTSTSRFSTFTFAAVTEVDEPSRRGDDDVTALAQRFHLTLAVAPAVDAFTCKPAPRPGVEDFVDLHAEFACGSSTNARAAAGPLLWP